MGALRLMSCMILMIRFGIAETYSYKGCYTGLKEKLRYENEYLFQSVSYCQEKCSGFAIVALGEGNKCYCGNDVSVLSQAKSASQSQCARPCVGYPFEICGGDDDNMSVYLNKNRENLVGNLSLESGTTPMSTSVTPKPTSNIVVPSKSSADSSSSSESHSEPKTPISQSATEKTLTRYSTQVVTSVIPVVTDNHDQQSNGSVHTENSTLSKSTVTPSATNSTPNQFKNSKESHLGAGAIAGIVLGACVFLALVVFSIMLYCHRRSEDESDLNETKLHQPYSLGSYMPFNNDNMMNLHKSLEYSSQSDHSGMPGIAKVSDGQFSPHNQFMHGISRVSSTSLPDMMEVRTLRITNPDQ